MPQGGDQRLLLLTETSILRSGTLWPTQNAYEKSKTIRLEERVNASEIGRRTSGSGLFAARNEAHPQGARASANGGQMVHLLEGRRYCSFIAAGQDSASMWSVSPPKVTVVG